MKTKTHLGKRVLSIVLSVLMVVTMLPTFALTSPVTASAVNNSSHLVGAYFTRNATDGIDTNSNVTWDSTTNAAYFNGTNSYVQLTGRPMAGVNSSTGFTIAFDVRLDTDHTNYWGRILDFNNGVDASSDSNACAYFFVAGAWGDDRLKSEVLLPGTTSASGFQPKPSFTENTFHTVVISYSSGTLSYYIDGNSVAASTTDLRATQIDIFSAFTHYYLGKSAWSADPYFEGYLRNVYLFDAPLTYNQVQSEVNTSGTLSDLETAISAYETKMNTTRSGAVYTNMGVAYQAYVLANRALDVYRYGRDTSVNLGLYTDMLNHATNQMSAWSAATGSAVQSYQANTLDSGVDRAARYSNNLLASNLDSTSGDTVAYTNTYSYTKVDVYYSKNVLLYDGSTAPKFPVTMSFNLQGAPSGVFDSNRPRYIHTMYPASSLGSKATTGNDSTEFVLDNDKHSGHAKCWVGYDGNTSRIDYSFIWGKSEKIGGDSTNSDSHYSSNNGGKGTKDRHCYVNAIKYCGGDFNSAIKDVQIMWAHRTSATEQQGTLTEDDYGSGSASVHTYVVNYKLIKTALSSNLSKFSTINYYKAGGALDVLFGYQIGAGLDLSSTRFTTNLDDALLSLKAQIETATAKMGAASTLDAAYAANYATYKTYLETSHTSTVANVDKRYTGTPIAAYNDGVNSGFTAATYTPYVTAYEAAAEEMAKVLYGGYTRNTEIGTAKSNLETRFNALEKSITYLPTVSAGGTHLNRTDNITFNLHASDAASSRIHYTIDYDNDTDVAEQTVTDGTTLQLFNNTSTSATVTYWSVNADGAQSATQMVTYYYLSAPTISVSDNAELDDYSKVRIYQSNTSNYQLKYSIDYWDYNANAGAGGWANSWSAYANPDGNNDFQPFGEGVNTTHSKVRIKVKQTNGTVTSDESTAVVVLKTPNLPVITTDGTLLDTSHGFTIADSNNDGYDGDVTIEYSYDGTNWTSYNGKVLPFSGKAAGDGQESKTVRAHAVRNGIYSGLETDTVKYLSRPVIKKGDVALAANDELLATDTLTIESTKDADGGTLKYAFSIDGGANWSDAKTYSSAITPFAETVTIGGNSVALSNKVNVKVKAWEEADDSISYENVGGPIILKRTEPLTVYYNADSEGNTAVVTATDTYNDNGHFFINTDGYSGCQIFYQTKVDGGSWSGFTSYSINGGVDTDTFSTNKIVEIRFFVIENAEKTVFASGTFYSSNNYNELAFKESFDSASASGSTLTLSGTNGTATASTSSGAAADTFSVVDGAGYSDGTNSPDWRNNVLKINSNNNNTYKLALATNPLSNSSTAYIAKKKGITISLWRYVPDGKFTNTAEYWTPTLSFSQPQGANGERYYFLTTESAYVTRSDSAIDGNNDYNKYVDIKPDVQDPTQHATGNRRNRWLNVVITVDPTSGVTVYTNGEPHNTTVTVGSGGTHGNYTGNNAALAQDILDFVTSASTTLSFADGQGYWSVGSKDLYLDDIRIYTDVKTQVDINNMYIYDADVESDITSTSHDPTNVTVYTLARAVETDSNGTKPVGAKVGQEFIDYYGLDATNSSDVSAIDEYSFGTGMTVYHYNKQTKKWDVVGDNAGRCGYQNEKLFGAEYTTGIADALSAATGSGSSTGAGYLVWAPHVMYNLTTDKWVYYGSTSSWGVQKSAIFMCQNDLNDDVTGPYTYKEITYKSTAHPNAIDACVYYQRDGSGKPVPSKLNMVFGSWGGSTAVASKELNANGTTTGNTSYDRIIAAGMTESASSDGSSAEGAWVTYANGYYYLYVSYGQNTGSYAERVFRSTTYNNNFVDLADISATNTEDKMKGNQILSPFDMSNYEYTFKSTGHNSIYKTVNNKGEVVTLHSTHARPNTNANHDWIAIPDNALATCQSEVDGNLNLINQVAYNSLGWPVLMPYQYDGTDTVKANIKGEDIEGVYAADDLRTYVSDTWAPQYNYTIVADDENPNAAYEYGTDEGGDTFTDYIVLSTGADGTRYANYYANKSDYDPENPNNNLAYCGVVGKHGDQICISMICPDDREHTWTYRIGKIPHSDEVDSLGESVSMDGVIYTHASTAATNNATFTYALYGTEISDDFQYGTSDLHQGERCTTITTSYPAKIDVSNPTAIYCVSDEAIAKSGDYSGSDFRVVALNDDKWFDEAGNRFSDVQAIDNNGISPNDGTTLKRRYGVKGFVSNYYYNSSTGEYKDTGVELIVSYTDVSTGSNYSEFEFCYVAANPSMAHTVSGSRSEHTYALQGDKRAGIILFDRFLGSTGTATNVRSNYTYQYNWDDSNYYKKGHENGIFNYLGEWGSSASLDDSARDYKTPENMANNFHDSSERVNGRTFASHNSGAFAQIEINRKVYRDAIATSPTVVDTDYYIDYSNEDNYDINNKYGTITTSAGKPTGYTFRMRTSNINWAPQQPRRWGATSYMLNNIVDVKGNKISADATYNSAKGDTLPTAPYQNYKDYSDSLNNDGQGETRLYYGNVNNTLATKNSDNASLESGMGEYSTNTTHHRGRDNDGNQFDFQAKYTLGMGDSAIGRKVMSGYYTNPTKYDELIADNDYYTKGISATGRDSNGNLTFTARSDGRIEKAFDYIDSGNSATNAWNMHIDFSGKNSVEKNTDTSLPAEQYANFILEQGISTMCYWFGTSTRYEGSVHEVYKYYNIGVHTCDKGAARSFAENYLRKKLAVTDNGDGTVTVKRNATTGAPIYLDASGNETNDVAEAAIITPSNYSLASYQAYIDAVAELNYFVKNPTNTTFGDYANSGTEPGEANTEYVTAYHDGVPYYVTSKGGANIFGDAGTVYTDKVQAKLIDNVITAYENLFAKEDYEDSKEDYESIHFYSDTTADTEITDKATATASAVKAIVIGDEGDAITFDNYTPDSWAAVVNLMKGVNEAFTYDKDTPTGKTSWRSAELDGATYRQLDDVMKSITDTLVPAVDISILTETYNTKQGSNATGGKADGSVTGGIFTSSAQIIDGRAFAAGKQVYTYASWQALSNACQDAHPLIDSTDNEHYARNQQATIDGDEVVGGADDEADFTYTQGQYAVTGVTKYTFGDDVTFYARTYNSGVNSDEQTAVNTANSTLAGCSMQFVDAASAYENFNAAKSAVDSIDRNKYTDAALTTFDSAVSTAYGKVYLAAGSVSDLPTGDKPSGVTVIKKTSTDQTDPRTAELLGAVTALNVDDNIKKFRATYTMQVNGTPVGLTVEEGPTKYGEKFTIDTAIADGQAATYSVTYYTGTADDYDDGEFTGTASVSQKFYVNGDTIEMIADKNMAIVAEMTEANDESTDTRINIYNAYKVLEQIAYTSSTPTYSGDTLTWSRGSLKAKEIPFYTCTGWNIQSRGGVYEARPIYDVAADTYTLHTTVGTVNGTVKYDDVATLSISNEELPTGTTFKGWTAVNRVSDNDKYAVISYNQDYSFYAVGSENFAPLVKKTSDGNYYVVTDDEGTLVKLTASNIDCTMTLDVDKDELIKQKLDNNAPFISAIKKVAPSATIEGKYVIRTYFRVSTTTGIKDIGSDIINVANPNNVKKIAASNILESGQFSISLLRSEGKGAYNLADYKFTGYVSYDFNYTFTGKNDQGETVPTTTTLNALDYTRVM